MHFLQPVRLDYYSDGSAVWLAGSSASAQEANRPATPIGTPFSRPFSRSRHAWLSQPVNWFDSRIGLQDPHG